MPVGKRPEMKILWGEQRPSQIPKVLVLTGFVLIVIGIISGLFVSDIAIVLVIMGSVFLLLAFLIPTIFGNDRHQKDL